MMEPQEHRIDLATGLSQDQDMGQATRSQLADIAANMAEFRRQRADRDAALARLRAAASGDARLHDLLTVLELW